MAAVSVKRSISYNRVVSVVVVVNCHHHENGLFCILCFHCHVAIKNKNANQSIQKVQKFWEIKEDKYSKSLAKKQDYVIIHMRDIQKNVLPKYKMLICIEMPSCWRPSKGHKYGRQKLTETSFFEFSFQAFA